MWEIWTFRYFGPAGLQALGSTLVAVHHIGSATDEVAQRFRFDGARDFDMMSHRVRMGRIGS
jgi:hypothetical protein